MDSGYHTYIRLSHDKLNEKKNLYSCLYIAEDEESEEEVIESFNKIEEDVVEDIVQTLNDDSVDVSSIVIEELEEDGWKKIGKKNKKKINQRNTHVGLWYNDQSWQHKLVNNLYVFKDTSMSVLEKYDLLYVEKMFKNAKNNYKRNKAYHKLMKTITLNEWDIISEFVEEIPVDRQKSN
jgi:hypothetical protein